MAINYTDRKKREDRAPKEKAWTGIIKDVTAYVVMPSAEGRGYVVMRELTKKQLDVLDEAPCTVDVSPDGTTVINLSRYCDVALFDDVGHAIEIMDDLPERFSATVNVRVRHCEYDYKAGKGYRAGHSSRLEVVGMRITSEPRASRIDNTEGL